MKKEVRCKECNILMATYENDSFSEQNISMMESCHTCHDHPESGAIVKECDYG